MPMCHFSTSTALLPFKLDAAINLELPLLKDRGQQQTLPKPAQKLSPREEFAKYYGFSLPPPPPPPQLPVDDLVLGHIPEYEGGYMIKPSPFPITTPYSSNGTLTLSQPNLNGQNNRRCNYCLQLNETPGPLCSPALLSPRFRRRPLDRTPSFIPTFPAPLSHDELLAKFNSRFVHSARMRSLITTAHKSSTPTILDRPIIPSSNTSLKSAPSRKKASSPGRSEISAPSGAHRSNEQEVFTWFTLGQASFKTRPWSYDNEQFTYPIVQLPSKTERWIVKETVGGIEKEVEIEIGVYGEPKRLFNFAPKVVLQG